MHRKEEILKAYVKILDLICMHRIVEIWKEGLCQNIEDKGISINPPNRPCICKVGT